MSLFQIIFLEYLQVFLPQSALFQFSIYVQDASSCHFTGISSHWYNSQFNFFPSLANLTLPILSRLLFPSSHYKGPWSSFILNCLLVHTHGMLSEALLIIIYNPSLVPSAKSFTWAYFCLIYSDPFWPTQYSHNHIMQVTWADLLLLYYPSLSLWLLNILNLCWLFSPWLFATDLICVLTPCPATPTLNNSSAFHQA